MPIDISLHPVQAKILDSLRFVRSARFSELNAEELTNAHFSFHINALLKEKLIEKSASGEYQLSQKGKQIVMRSEKQGTISVLLVIVDETQDPHKVLIQKRLRHPYFGFYGFVGGK